VKGERRKLESVR